MSHRDQHYVPRFLLEEWHSPPDGKLSQFQWIRGALVHHRYSAKAVAKEPHLYSRMRESVEPDVAIERDFLGPHVDEPASLVHKAMLANGVRSLTTEQKLAWSRFLVSLMLRLPKMMANMRSRGRAILEAGLDEQPEEFRELRGDAPEKTLKEWVSKHMPWEFDDLAVRTLPELVNSTVLNTAFLQGTTWATRPIPHPKWDLLIGDRPLIYKGTMQTSFLFVLPLSPRRVFFACDNRATWENITRLGDDEVLRTINRETVATADRYVYATGRQQEALIRKSLRKPQAA